MTCIYCINYTVLCRMWTMLICYQQNQTCVKPKCFFSWQQTGGCVSVLWSILPYLITIWKKYSELQLQKPVNPSFCSILTLSGNKKKKKKGKKHLKQHTRQSKVRCNIFFGQLEWLTSTNKPDNVQLGAHSTTVIG